MVGAENLLNKVGTNELSYKGKPEIRKSSS